MSKPQSSTLCSVAQCGSPTRTKGFCHSHYAKYRRYGDPLYKKPHRLCVVTGCGRKHCGHGFCAMHLKRWQKHGDALYERPKVCTIPGCVKRHRCRGYCGTHYEKLRIHGDPNYVSKFTSPGQGLAFLASLVGTTRKECIIWPFGKAGNYGVITINGKHRSAHAVMLELAVGPAPEGHIAGHGPCHNTLCVNPNGHISWITKAQNVAEDRIRDGTMIVGEQHWCAKLCNSDIAEIRKLSAEGVLQKIIAAQFNTTQTHVSDIVTRRTWKHLP